MIRCDRHILQVYKALHRLYAALILSSCAFVVAAAQTPPANSPPAPLQDLTELEGLYRYRDGGTLVIVTDRDQLVAIIREAKYPLRAMAPDTFANGSGDVIPFVRDANGQIVAFEEQGDSFTRLSETVSAETRALLVPRPAGADRPYRCVAPTALDDGLRVGTPGPQTLPCDVSAAIVNGILDGVYPDVRSILVHHQGALVLEEYFYGYHRDRPHQMRSLTKSVIALLAGAAVDRGLLSPDEPMLAQLGAADIAHPDPRKTRITLTDLLSHQSGLACDDRDAASPGNEVTLYDSADWINAFLDLPVLAEPGTVGRYCSIGILAAGRMVERAAQMPLADFAQEVLFGPLGISRDQWRWTFVLDRSQRNEYGQIHLRPRDMLKLGLLVQQRGMWQDRRVISNAWVDAAVAKQSRVDDSDYGLGIWHRWYSVLTASGSQRVETIMLSGNGGQKVYLVPSLDLVVMFTGGAFNAESPVNGLMARVVLPAMVGVGGN
jgi:CubicO group peptidase (beta-lactamase class C family)